MVGSYIQDEAKMKWSDIPFCRSIWEKTNLPKWEFELEESSVPNKQRYLEVRMASCLSKHHMVHEFSECYKIQRKNWGRRGRGMEIGENYTMRNFTIITVPNITLLGQLNQ